MQKIPHPRDLKFHLIEDEKAPELTCGICGTKKPGHGMLAAEVKFAADAYFMIVLCDDVCKQKFVTHPKSQKYIHDNVHANKKLHRDRALKRM